MGQKTQPTVSKHWRKIGSQGLRFNPIRSTPLCSQWYHNYAVWNKIHTDKHKWIYAQWNGPSETNPIQRTVRTAHLSVLMTVHSFSTQYNTVLIISPLTSRQTSYLRCCLLEEKGGAHGGRCHMIYTCVPVHTKPLYTCMLLVLQPFVATMFVSHWKLTECTLYRDEIIS